jgi:hypothetical protein
MESNYSLSWKPHALDKFPPAPKKKLRLLYAKALYSSLSSNCRLHFSPAFLSGTGRVILPTYLL